MSGRFDLTDKEWSIIEPLLPNKPRGVPRVDDRTVLNGVRSSASHSGFCERARLGKTCLRVTGLARPSTIASTVGVKRACGNIFSSIYRLISKMRCT